MTRIAAERPVTRETEAKDRGRPLVMELRRRAHQGLRADYTRPYDVLLDVGRRRQFGLTHNERIPAARKGRGRTREEMR